MLGTSQRLTFVPQINTVLLLGAPMLPTWSRLQQSLLWTLSRLLTAESLATVQDLLQTHFTISELSTQTALPVAS
jgi:hypothetical protein